MTQHPQTWAVLARVVDNLTYVDGSRFTLARDDASNYCVLYVFLHAPNSYREDRADRFTRNEFVVPVATYDYENWRRWVYERLKAAAIHEVGEWFKDSGVRVYPPYHGNGEDPYVEWTGGSPERAAKAPGDD